MIYDNTGVSSSVGAARGRSPLDGPVGRLLGLSFLEPFFGPFFCFCFGGIGGVQVGVKCVAGRGVWLLCVEGCR
jgi:hypothetical protein